MSSSRKQTCAYLPEVELVGCNMVVQLDFMHGLMFGIGHIDSDEEDDFHYMIVVSFAFLQLTFIKYKPEQ